MRKPDPFSEKTVLIVDDNPFDRNMIEQFLRSNGIGTILMVPDAVQALALLGEKNIDCMFVDWEMAPHNGLTLVRQIRRAEDQPYRTVSIILCTSHTERERIFEARDAGIDEIIAKPFSALVVKQKLTAALFHRREFIVAKSYVGPDRRRFVAPWEKDERRMDKKPGQS